MDGEYTAVTFISISALRKTQNARGTSRDVRRYSPLGCHRQRDISKLFQKLRFLREQASRLRRVLTEHFDITCRRALVLFKSDYVTTEK